MKFYFIPIVGFNSSDYQYLSQIELQLNKLIVLSS